MQVHINRTETFMLGIGVIGYGYWGQNIVRNLSTANGSQVVMVCDMDKQNLKKVTKTYPQTRVTVSSEDLINDPAVEAVAVATPVFTHHG